MNNADVRAIAEMVSDALAPMQRRNERVRLAAAALHGVTQRCAESHLRRPKEIARLAVEVADEVLQQLDSAEPTRSTHG